MTVPPIDVAALLMTQGPIMLMLATAWGLRRSLGAWPVYLTVGGVFAGVELCMSAQSGRLDVANFLSMMVSPSLLFVLARRQVVPGLRRGQMSEAERLRWIARESLKRSASPSPTRGPWSPTVRNAPLRPVALLRRC